MFIPKATIIIERFHIKLKCDTSGCATTKLYYKFYFKIYFLKSLSNIIFSLGVVVSVVSNIIFSLGVVVTLNGTGAFQISAP